MMIKRVSSYESDESLEWKPEGMSPFTIMCHPLVYACPPTLFDSVTVRRDLVHAFTYHTYMKHIGPTQQTYYCHAAVLPAALICSAHLHMYTEYTGSLNAFRTKQHAGLFVLTTHSFLPKRSSDGIHFQLFYAELLNIQTRGSHQAVRWSCSTS